MRKTSTERYIYIYIEREREREREREEGGGGETDQDANGVRRFWRESEGKEAANISFNPQNGPANCPPISLNCRRSISKTKQIDDIIQKKKKKKKKKIDDIILFICPLKSLHSNF